MQKNLLRAELAKRGLTQQQLAQMIGLTPQTLSKQINTGKIGLKQAEKISSILNLDKSKTIEIFLPNI